MLSFLEPKDGPVAPGEEEREVVYAKNQIQYKPLRTLRGDAVDSPVISRWSPTDEQRKMIAEGKDIFLELLTFHQPLQPILVYVGDDSDKQEISYRAAAAPREHPVVAIASEDEASKGEGI